MVGFCFLIKPPAYILIGELQPLTFSVTIESLWLFPTILLVCFLHNPHLLFNSSNGIYPCLYFPGSIYIFVCIGFFYLSTTVLIKISLIALAFI
jgi:hypothetical protein